MIQGVRLWDAQRIPGARGFLSTDVGHERSKKKDRDEEAKKKEAYLVRASGLKSQWSSR